MSAQRETQHWRSKRDLREKLRAKFLENTAAARGEPMSVEEERRLWCRLVNIQSRIISALEMRGTVKQTWSVERSRVAEALRKAGVL